MLGALAVLGLFMVAIPSPCAAQKWLEIGADPVEVVMSEGPEQVRIVRRATTPGDLMDVGVINLASSDLGVFTVPSPTVFGPTMDLAQTNTVNARENHELSRLNNLFSMPTFITRNSYKECE